MFRRSQKRYISTFLPRFRMCARRYAFRSVYAGKAGVAAELIGVPRGSIGEQLYFSKAYFMTADLFAWTFVIVILSIVFEKIILLLTDKAFLLFERM